MARQHGLEPRHAGHDAQGQTGVAVSAERMRHCLRARQTNAHCRDLLGVLDARSPATQAMRLSVAVDHETIKPKTVTNGRPPTRG
jgi:hypothetical protein